MGSSISRPIFVGPNAKYHSISEGIAHAEPGSTIFVFPGTYAEAKEITINKPIHIIGVKDTKIKKVKHGGKKFEALLEEERKPKQISDFFAVKLNASFYVNHADSTRNVSFENVELSSSSNTPLNLLGGSVFVYNCRIINVTGANSNGGVVVSGRSVIPTIKNTFIENAGNCGIVWSDGSNGTMEDCYISNCQVGVLIKELADPHISSTEVTRCGTGVHVTEKGKGVFTNCTSSFHTKPCLLVTSEGNPILSDCVISSSNSDGVYCREANCVLTKCMITDNALPGIAICEGANPLISSCSISDGRNAGVLVFERGKGVFDDCLIKGNRMPGIEVRSGGAPLVRNSEISDGKSNGIYVHNKGKGLFCKTVICNSVLPSVAVRSGGDPLFHECVISAGKDSAVLGYENGKGAFVGCTIRGEATKPIELNDGCQPVFQNCTVVDGKKENVEKWLARIPRDKDGKMVITYPKEPEVVQSDDEDEPESAEKQSKEEKSSHKKADLSEGSEEKENIKSSKRRTTTEKSKSPKRKTTNEAPESNADQRTEQEKAKPIEKDNQSSSDRKESSEETNESSKETNENDKKIKEQEIKEDKVSASTSTSSKISSEHDKRNNVSNATTSTSKEEEEEEEEEEKEKEKEKEEKSSDNENKNDSNDESVNNESLE